MTFFKTLGLCSLLCLAHAGNHDISTRNSLAGQLQAKLLEASRYGSSDLKVRVLAPATYVSIHIVDLGDEYTLSTREFSYPQDLRDFTTAPDPTKRVPELDYLMDKSTSVRTESIEDFVSFYNELLVNNSLSPLH